MACRVIEWKLIGDTTSMYNCKQCGNPCTSHHFQLLEPHTSYICPSYAWKLDFIVESYLEVPLKPIRWLAIMYDKQTMETDGHRVPTMVKI